MPVDQRDDFPSQPAQPISASVAAAQAAADAARTYTLATRAYNLDQLDIEDPSLPPKGSGDSGASRQATGLEASTSPGPESPDPFPQDLLRRASEAGIGPSEAREFGTPQALERAVELVRRNRQTPRQPEPQRQPRRQPEPQPAPLPELPDLGSYVHPQGHEFAGQPVFDPRLEEAFRARDEALLSALEEVRQLKSDLGGVRQTAAQAQAEQVNARYDAAFNAVPDEYKGLVGTGTHHDLSADGAEYQARMEVFLHAEGAREAYLKAGRTPPPFQTLFGRALRAVLGEQAQKATSQRQAERARNASGQFISPPTQSRNGSQAAPPTPAEADRHNVARLEARLREIGWN